MLDGDQRRRTQPDRKLRRHVPLCMWPCPLLVGGGPAWPPWGQRPGLHAEGWTTRIAWGLPYSPSVPAGLAPWACHLGHLHVPLPCSLGFCPTCDSGWPGFPCGHSAPVDTAWSFMTCLRSHGVWLLHTVGVVTSPAGSGAGCGPHARVEGASESLPPHCPAGGWGQGGLFQSEELSYKLPVT